MAQVKKTALEEALQNVGQRISNVTSTVKGSANVFLQHLDSLQQNVGEKVASIPYARSNYQQGLVKRFGIPIDFNKMQVQEERTVNLIESKPPLQQPLMEQSFFPELQQVKGGSAQMYPFISDITPIPKANPYLERMKQEVLNNPNLRPVAKAYLSKVPVVYEKMEGAGGQAKQKYIGISSQYENVPIGDQAIRQQEDTIKTIIQHELLHKTPNLVPTQLFDPKNQEIINQYVDRWGKDYFKNNPKVLVGEMFAEQELPPAYYWHIFKSVNPRSTKQDFIGYLKSWFLNEINNPTLKPQLPNTQSVPATIIPMSGGGQVQQ